MKLEKVEIQVNLDLEMKNLLKSIRETYLVDMPLSVQDRVKLMKQTNDKDEIMSLINDIILKTQEYIELKKVLED